MDEHHDEWSELLSEHLDGSLSPEQALGMETHLRECDACTRLLGELSQVRDAARGLEDRPPARDLWPSIRGAIQPAVLEDTGGASPAQHRGWGLVRRRVTLSLAELSLAAALVTIAAGGAAWALRPLTRTAPAPTAGPSGAPASFAGTPVVQGPEGSSGDLEALRALLAQDRDRLSPRTVRILEKNLDLIDRAIRESTDALAQDPENPFLEEHLRRAYERRAEYLQEATALLETAG